MEHGLVTINKVCGVMLHLCQVITINQDGCSITAGGTSAEKSGSISGYFQKCIFR